MQNPDNPGASQPINRPPDLEPDPELAAEQAAWRSLMFDLLGLTRGFMERPGGSIVRRPDFRSHDSSRVNHSYTPHNRKPEEERRALQQVRELRMKTDDESFQQELRDYFEGAYEAPLKDPIQSKPEEVVVFKAPPTPRKHQSIKPELTPFQKARTDAELKDDLLRKRGNPYRSNIHSF